MKTQSAISKDRHLDRLVPDPGGGTGGGRGRCARRRAARRRWGRRTRRRGRWGWLLPFGRRGQRQLLIGAEIRLRGRDGGTAGRSHPAVRPARPDAADRVASGRVHRTFGSARRDAADPHPGDGPIHAHRASRSGPSGKGSDRRPPLTAPKAASRAKPSAPRPASKAKPSAPRPAAMRRRTSTPTTIGTTITITTMMTMSGDTRWRVPRSAQQSATWPAPHRPRPTCPRPM